MKDTSHPFLRILLGVLTVVGVLLAAMCIAGNEQPPLSCITIEDQKAYVLVEWDAEIDIDLCVYNEQSDRCIGTISFLSDNDEFLYCDNDGSEGYELVSLENYEEGAYTVYLKRGDVSAEDKETTSAVVSIYAQEGLLFQKKIQMVQDVKLVKCAYMAQGEVQGQEEYIHDLTDYAWAARNKREPRSWAKEENIQWTEEYRFRSHGDFPLWRIKVYGYNEEGRLSTQIEYSSAEYSATDDDVLPFELYQHNGKFIYNPVAAYQYEYDGYGNEKQVCIYNPAGLDCVCRYEYQYDEDGKVLLCERYNSYPQDGEEIFEFLAEREKLEYDDFGNLTARYYAGNSDEEWKLLDAYEYQYDEEGRITAR